MSDNLERQVERCYLLKLLPVPLDVIRSILWERILGHRRCVCFRFFPQVAVHSRFESYAQGQITLWVLNPFLPTFPQGWAFFGVNNMSLIDRLGGYDVVKAKYQTLGDSDVITIGPFSVPAKPFLEAELLEYRREHNMYEVGDKYVMLKLWHDDLMTVVDRDLEEPCWNPRIIRHADDAEIEANRRLDL